MNLTDHEQALVSTFVLPEKRVRYGEFLPNPKRRAEITRRFNHAFDFIPVLSTRIPRGTASEIATLLRNYGAGKTAHLIGGGDAIDGLELPLVDALEGAFADANGVVVSCIPGRLALYVQEFPPGDTFILRFNP